ncbi:MAG: hypothetical protein JJU29_22565 [Verrucomicrobia bacterium]|nr:hypothetical protein [Verrucomicrobiota bacterium]MCH8514336.1 hypothetical protein [Kiritimatiellia bacterium]
MKEIKFNELGLSERSGKDGVQGTGHIPDAGKCSQNDPSVAKFLEYPMPRGIEAAQDKVRHWPNDRRFYHSWRRFRKFSPYSSSKDVPKQIKFPSMSLKVFIPFLHQQVQSS